METIIKKSTFNLRKIKSDDIDSLLKIYQKDENIKFIPNAAHQWTKNKLIEKYEKINRDYKNGFGIFVIETKNKDIIGEAGLFNSFQDLKHLELGYIIDNKFWNKGYGTEICMALIKYAFEQLNANKITARMFKQNIASVRLSEKCGMQLIYQGKTNNGDIFCEYQIEKEI